MRCEAFLGVGESSVIPEELHDLVEVQQGIAAIDFHLYIDRPDVCELRGYA